MIATPKLSERESPAKKKKQCSPPEAGRRPRRLWAAKPWSNRDRLRMKPVPAQAGMRCYFLFSPSSGEPMGSALFAFFSSVIRVPVMGSAPFTLLPRVICAPVLGRTYSATPTLFHADLYEIFYGNWRAKFPSFFSGRGESFRFGWPICSKMILQHVMRLAANV